TSRRRHTRSKRDWSSDVCSSDLPALPKGEYQLSSHVGGRGVYTFCMCPGGQVVAAASEAGGCVTNGMSLHARDGANANAAVVVEIGRASWRERVRNGGVAESGEE